MSATAESRTLADDELLVTRVFDAPVSLVFRLWESPEHRVRWWAPKDFTCSHFEADFRPGGIWRAAIVGQGYGESWMGGVFREIERDRKIVFTFAWEDGRDQPGVETLVTVTFHEQDGKTVQSFHQCPLLTVEARDSHIAGWNETFDRQQAYAEGLAREPGR
jgi:uncharacterized protein YndB with AHSA1/START domain